MTVTEHAHSALLPRLIAKAQSILNASPACHDWDHTLRVLNNARHLVEAESGDAGVVEFAAVLHDIGRPVELADTGKTCHAERGGDMVLRLLPELGLTDGTFIEQVAHCVRAHRYRRRSEGTFPATLEARIVFDADKLDCIGAIGIGRSFHFAGRTGARVHNTAEEAVSSASYSREDTAYREYLVKLEHVHERMMTGEGKRMAAGRHDFMVAFFGQLNQEVQGRDYA